MLNIFQVFCKYEKSNIRIRYRCGFFVLARLMRLSGFLIENFDIYITMI